MKFRFNRNYHRHAHAFGQIVFPCGQIIPHRRFFSGLQKSLAILFIFLFAVLLYFPLVYVHEGLHWIQNDIDPDLTPVTIECFTENCYKTGALGRCYYIVINDNLTDKEIQQKCLFQEFVCYTTCLIIQEILAVLISIYSIDFINKRFGGD